MILTILVVIAALVILWGILAYNGFIKEKNRIEEAFSTMDVYMKKRYDLIPNLVETVKGYAAHETSTLNAVTRARNAVLSASTQEEKLKGEHLISDALRSLFAVAEAYPDLKANQNFLDLQSNLQRIEDEIANARKYYNAVVKTFNTKTETFPSNLIAGLFHFERRPMFEVSREEERNSVQVKF